MARGSKWHQLRGRSAPKVRDGEENTSNEDCISLLSLLKCCHPPEWCWLGSAGLRWCSTVRPASLVSAVAPPKTSRRPTATAPGAPPAVSGLQSSCKVLPVWTSSQQESQRTHGSVETRKRRGSRAERRRGSCSCCSARDLLSCERLNLRHGGPWQSCCTFYGRSIKYILCLMKRFCSFSQRFECCINTIISISVWSTINHPNIP